MVPPENPKRCNCRKAFWARGWLLKIRKKVGPLPDIRQIPRCNSLRISRVFFKEGLSLSALSVKSFTRKGAARSRSPRSK